jgi:hypothetical protein
MHAVLKERYGQDVRIKTIAARRSLIALPRIGFDSRAMQPGLVGDVVAGLEDRALWSRLGL